MKTLITKSLIDSWHYYLNCEEDDEGRAEKEWMQTLRREEKPPNEKAQKGIYFEEEVYRACNGVKRNPHKQWESGIQGVADVIKGARLQYTAKRDLTLPNGRELLVYGRLDALKAGVIYDVKFSTKSFGSVAMQGKYFSNPQHPAYMFIIPEAYAFTYVISDGRDVYTETYTRKQTRPFEEVAIEFFNWLESYPDMMAIYNEKWEAM